MACSEQRRNSGISGLAGMAALLILLMATVPAAKAQTYTVIHTFTGGTDGGQPYSGLTMDAAGNLYGVASAGGIGNYGVVYKLAHTSGGWVFTTLYTFKGGNDGAIPVATPIFGPDGALYGTTGGGGGGGGTVYKLVPPPSACKNALCEWTETVLYRASTDNGYGLAGEVLFDKAGNIYSTVAEGGENEGGYVFELTPYGNNWASKVLYSFNPFEGDCNDPEAGLVFDSSGNLYGTANTGCALNGGVFELTPSGSGWTESIVRAFNDLTDGNGSQAGLTPDGHGDFYGTTFDLGPKNGGTVFELTPSNQGWAFSIVYAFNISDDDGQYLLAPVSLDASGNLYGTTFECVGAQGTVFKLTPSSDGWTETVLYRFTGGNDGGEPYSNVVMDAHGNLYGTASFHGADDNGVVWEITP
jgi:hypothetical protein